MPGHLVLEKINGIEQGRQIGKFTSQFICTPAELTDGRVFGLYPPGPVPRGIPVVFQLRRAIVTGTGK